MKKTGTILILTLLAFSLNAQENTDLNHQKLFGIGVYINHLKISESQNSDDLISFPKVEMNLHSSDKFRIGSTIGFQYENNDSIKNLGYLIGFNFHGVLDKGKVNFLYGLMFNYQNLSESDVYTNSFNSSHIEKAKRISFGPEIGSEYFLSPHLSIGCKLGLISSREKNIESVNIYYESIGWDRYFSFRPETGISVKFWF